VFVTDITHSGSKPSIHAVSVCLADDEYFVTKEKGPAVLFLFICTFCLMMSCFIECSSKESFG